MEPSITSSKPTTKNQQVNEEIRSRNQKEFNVVSPSENVTKTESASEGRISSSETDKTLYSNVDSRGLMISSSSEAATRSNNYRLSKKIDFYDSTHEENETNVNRTRGNDHQGVTRLDSRRTEERDITFVELINLESEESDSDVPRKKPKLRSRLQGSRILLSDLKEFQSLSTAQKACIRRIVDECVNGVLSFSVAGHKSSRATGNICGANAHCKKFILPWVLVKTVQFVLSVIILCVFFYESGYFRSGSQTLPVAATVFFTMTLLAATLLSYTICSIFAYNVIQLLAVVFSAILTLSTTSGLLVMLSIDKYYQNDLQISALFFTTILQVGIIAELILSYLELKRSWNKIASLQ